MTHDTKWTLLYHVEYTYIPSREMLLAMSQKIRKRVIDDKLKRSQKRGLPDKLRKAAAKKTCDR